MKKFTTFLKKTWWLFLILFMAPLVVIFLFVVLEYVCKQVDLSAGEWSQLLGSAFGYWGTVILGTITFWQNDQLKEENDILSQYEITRNLPKFFVQIEEYTGMLQNICIRVENCSDNIAYKFNISEISVFRKNCDSKVLIGKYPPCIREKNEYLLPHTYIDVNFNNSRITIGSNEKIYFVFTIFCADILGNLKMTELTIEVDDKMNITYRYADL